MWFLLAYFYQHSQRYSDNITNINYLLISYKATLLVAINEIKKSARKQEVSFYEYGMYFWLTIQFAFDVN